MITSETARSCPVTPLKKAAGVFPNQLKNHTDAVFLSLETGTVFAVTGLPFAMPVCSALLNQPDLYALLGRTDENLLLDLTEEVLYQDSTIVKPDENQLALVRDVINRYQNAAGTLLEDGSIRLDLKSASVGTHYGVNLLLGDREGFEDPLQTTPKSVLDQFGRGSFRGAREKQVLATAYQLDPAVNGETANRQFYLTENGKQIFYSLDVKNNVKDAYCVHHNNYTEIFYETACGLTIRRTIFLLPQEKDFPSAAEVQRITITNHSGKDRKIRLVVTGMFGITDPGTLAGDIIYANVVVEGEVYKIDDIPAAIAAHHKPAHCNNEKRFAMLLSEGKAMEEYTDDLAAFLGQGTYDSPEGLLRLNNSLVSRGAAFFAMAITMDLPEGRTKSADSFACMSENREDVREDVKKHIQNLYLKYRDPSSVPQVLEKAKKKYDEYCSFLRFESSDPLLASYINRNLPFQVLYQTYVSRSFAWTQKSYRETGFREIQDLFASMYYMHAAGKDELVKELLSRWIVNVFEFGYAYHNFTDRGKEPGMCSDDQLWLAQAVYRYVLLTGDKDFLLQEFPPAGSGRCRRLIDTLKAILTYSGCISIGKHGLPLLDTADWNDTLRLDQKVYSGPEKEKDYYRQLKEKGQPFGVPWENSQSESVMNAFLFVIAAEETAELAALVNDTETVQMSTNLAVEMKKKINTYAWNKDYYARCLINDGRPFRYLGSTGDGLSASDEIPGTYYLNSFSWALLSGTADQTKISAMLEIVEKYLKTDAGLKLCTPVEYDQLGVVTGTSFYFPGDRENGGVFKHAAMMASVAALKASRSIPDQALSKRLKDLALFMIGKTLPFKALEDPFVLKGNPRFCTQYNNSVTGENIGPVLSGTASWLTLALYELCGLNVHGGQYTLKPLETETDLICSVKL